MTTSINDTVKRKGCQLGARHTLSFLAFLGFSIVYLLRVNLSVALVAMVSPQHQQTSSSEECPIDEQTISNISDTNADVHLFNWNRDLQGAVLGSFFYGYVVTQIPGGWLAGKYGGKILFGVGVLCTSVFTILSPVAANWSVYALVTLRILEGITEGVTFPAMHAMWSDWAPPLERGKLVMFSMSGAEFGTIIGMPLSGYICSRLGWPWLFYICGTLGCIWFVAWMLLTANTPAKHTRISDEEREYIINEIAKTKTYQQHITLKNTPWLSIFTSKSLWGLCAAHVSDNWGYYTLLTCLPLFMKDVLHFDLSQDSFLSCLPYLCLGFTKSLTNFLVDNLRKKGFLSTGMARKLALGIGLTVSAACLIGVGYVGCDYYLAVVLLCIAGLFEGIAESSYNVNHLDIAPKYAGTLLGITNTFASIPGFLAPQVVGWLTDSASTSLQWRSVFFVSAEIYIFGAAMFTILGSGDVQHWAFS